MILNLALIHQIKIPYSIINSLIIILIKIKIN